MKCHCGGTIVRACEVSDHAICDGCGARYHWADRMRAIGLFPDGSPIDAPDGPEKP